MDAVFRRARLEDIDQLLTLYRHVYGKDYKLPLGTDPVVMAAEITRPTTTWLVAEQPGSGRIVASIMATVEPADRLGKLQGLVVHRDCRGTGIAHEAVRQLSETLLSEQRHQVDSVYATARTTATAPQRICLRNGFRPLGMLPNLRKAARQETMVLLAKHREGVLERRHPVPRIPAALANLVSALDGPDRLPELVDAVPAPAPGRSVPAELVDAPQFVLRRFREVVTDPTRRFYPFHSPNVLVAAEDGSYELYAHLSRCDGYCTLIGAAPSALALADHLESLIEQLAGLGAGYVETLLPLDCLEELNLLLAHGFLPAAAYPAMRRDGEGFRDYVVMARTMQPLDFRGLAIDETFRPFTEQYVDLWKRRYLDTGAVYR
ncbi:hypothetical protein GCM10010174_76050 [Kutzneria viridogrisea]|uniref:N-acetyltransferase domain-containing protein n=2 Tax=Kutzneria TaxID=43356 RepID=W5W590_9PSEU|nr:GNAT family N-acetyltransferase [Kutzneria albida]AHH96393.1 hypothetical protein KALB_3025 [Kutzneria albida DSM 43870]MBA8928391.1 N-acetylglutamate synthase-like GNAT family acetyltransferase [Kutzneria viridogrisea]